MNKKLKKLIEDEEDTLVKIEELQAHLRDVRKARKEEENLEIIRSFRAMKLEPRELMTVLNGIQSGSISLENFPELTQEGLSAGDDISESASKRRKRKNTGAEDAPESEGNNG